jgi:hypothetical protein
MFIFLEDAAEALGLALLLTRVAERGNRQTRRNIN